MQLNLAQDAALKGTGYWQVSTSFLLQVKAGIQTYAPRGWW